MARRPKAIAFAILVLVGMALPGGARAQDAQDSIELVELGIKIEKHFAMKLPMSDLRRCITVEEIIQLVQQIKEEEHL